MSSKLYKILAWVVFAQVGGGHVIPSSRQVVYAPQHGIDKPLTVPPLLKNEACSCGIRGSDNNGNGINAGLHEFPWRCALYTPTLGVFCGATIIDNSWVMTAAHCTKTFHDAAEVYVDCADHDVQTLDDTDNVLVKVDRVVQHPLYNSTSQDYDLSLLHLTNPLEYNDAISPVCLPFANEGEDCERKGAIVTASGWGSPPSGGKGAAVLHKIDLPCMGTNACQGYYDTSVTDNMICTYQPGKDTCYGDSGSSIDFNARGRYYALGIVSWGVGCAEEGNPGVYTKVSKFLSWIQFLTDASFCRP